jgi:hypothetical protein
MEVEVELSKGIAVGDGWMSNDASGRWHAANKS